MKWDLLESKFDLAGRRVIASKRPKVRRTNVQEVQRIFHVLNAECFDNFLNQPNFIVDSLARYTRRSNGVRFKVLGLYEQPTPSWKAFDPLGYKRACSSTISIEHRLQGWELCEVVFHEMIHYFQFEAGWQDDKDPHGLLFQDDYSKRIEVAKKAYFDGKISLDK